MNRYQRAREMAGYTQKELATKLGLKPAVISRYESEEATVHITPSVERAKEIAEICSVSVSFLTDEKKLYYLDDEQAARFREEISTYNDGLKHWPEETEACYGTTHPFLYMLKDRWKPTVEDVEYVQRKFGIQGKYILNKYVVNRAAASKQIKDYNDKTAVERTTYTTASKVIDYFWARKEESIGFTDAQALILDGVIIIEKDGVDELYLNITDVDYDIVESVITIVNKNRRKEQENREWKELMERAFSEEEKPPQNPEDPETAENSIQK